MRKVEEKHFELHSVTLMDLLKHILYFNIQGDSKMHGNLSEADFIAKNRKKSSYKHLSLIHI